VKSLESDFFHYSPDKEVIKKFYDGLWRRGEEKETYTRKEE
jgi:hypothetical protein